MQIALCTSCTLQLTFLRESSRNCAHWQHTPLEINEFTTGMDLLSALHSGKRFESIFLEIEMLGISGISLFNELYKRSANSVTVILISSHTEMLPDAYAVLSGEFLAKPYNQETFDMAVKRTIDQKEEKRSFKYMRDCTNISVPYKDIRHFKIKNYVLTMHCTNGSIVRFTNKSLDEVERELSDFGFFRCNRSVLINMQYYFNREGILLSNDTSDSDNEQIEISRRRLKAYDRQLALFMSGR